MLQPERLAYRRLTYCDAHCYQQMCRRSILYKYRNPNEGGTIESHSFDRPPETHPKETEGDGPDAKFATPHAEHGLAL